MNKKEILKNYSKEKKELLTFFKNHKIKGLYRPIHYIFDSEGKNIRPFFLIWIYKLYGGRKSNINFIALAIQALHNFTLIHDDIMDGSLKRRGKLTVHEKWGINTGILSGDALMIYSYKLLLSKFENKKIINLFSNTATDICEGQQLDMDLQKKNKASLKDYLEMINLKTGALFAFSFQIGPILAGLNVKEQKKMRDIGVLLGQIFQIQDDYLDLYGGKKLGKQKGLDVMENKKTYLFFVFYMLANNNDIKEFENSFYSEESLRKRLIKIKNLFKKYKIKDQVSFKINELMIRINLIIDKVHFSLEKKKQLKNYIKLLSNRDC